jgi:putative membrane protein
MIGWHVPAAFELALRSEAWHNAEHACFFFTSILFWWPVIQPWPSVARWPRWAMPIYLLLGMIAGSAVSAYMTFSDVLLYPSYRDAPRIFAISPMDDQVAAGGLMWFVMAIAFLIPAVAITIRFLSPSRPRAVARRVSTLDAGAS